MVGLVDLPLDGYTYTWSHKSASKMSKLDRFLISEGLLLVFPFLSAICLDRYLSDHRPILLRELDVDYGPTPFRFFHFWSSKSGFDKLVEETWKNANIVESNDIILLKKKFQMLKGAIKNWCKEDNKRSNGSIAAIKLTIADVDKILDQGNGFDDLVNERSMLLKELLDFNARLSLDMAQKAKIRWSIEGDENSKYFHGIINRKRSQLAIRGVLIEGDWIDEPSIVKNEFLSHFVERFSSPPTQRITLDAQFPNHLSFEQHQDLERSVTYDEIKCAVWDCGSNKSPGPDGFTFDFYRRYWKLIDQDVVNAVSEFFSSGMFPLGCNSPFITLMLKLSLVIPDLISDVQSAFVANRQILDGLFIINELISWCKYKKKKAMIFKVDFEKAFDSIQGCLNSAMGSILVNGSPTPEFKFHKGLYKGIQIDDSLTLSYLFYADDAVFIGKWDKSNINVIVGVSSSRSCSWEDVLSKITVRLSKWKLKTLSIGGRLTLLKVVLTSMPLYQMSVYKVPMGVLNRMESMRRNFFNGVDNNDRKITMIGLKKILATKKKGGLGVSSFFAINRALLFKWVWRFKSNHSSMWYRCIKAIYGDRGALDTPGILARRSPWTDIIREFHSLSSKGINLHAFVKMKVGDESDKHACVAAKFRDTSMSASFRRVPRGGLEVEQFQLLVDKVAPVILSSFKDRWALDSGGEFSVKSTRSYIDDYLLPTVGPPMRWVNVVPIKINIFAWRISLDRLPTRFNLSFRGIDVSSILCPICSSAGETSSHLLFSCNVARQLLFKIARWWELDIQEFHSYED
ncbi:RNA-directed DNA polymerase, eukaryota [Tanacetum coccineum]